MLNLAEKNVVIHGAEVMLTNREFEILYLLAQSPGRIFSKEQTFGYFPELTVVFCQALFPEKSVGIPCFYPGKFPDSGG